MSDQSQGKPESLSPVSRRAFFRGMGANALKIGALGAAAASMGQNTTCNIPDIIVGGDGGGGGDCGYCDGEGRDYDHCDGDYCDYINYSDTSGSTNCGYCDGDGRDYEHCDGDYCDYINYADGS